MYNLKFLVHIPFHYSLPREKYLLQILENFQSYQLKTINVVIDTNTEESKERLSKFIEQLSFNVEIHCHKNLLDPFDLTWTHRQQILEQKDNYDLFMYSEDDILIPWTHFEDWLIDNEQIYNKGYIRGFVRVEESKDGKLYLTDFETSMFNTVIFKIGKKYYFQPKYPYYACWVYNQKQLHDFIQSPAWIDGNCQGNIRERAAVGMMWKINGHHDIVLPINVDKTIDTKALIYHLPNNYQNNPDEPLGKIPVDNLIRGKLFEREKLVKWDAEICSYLQAEDYTALREFYEKLIETEPEIPSVYCKLGLAYLLEGKEEEAQLTWSLLLMNQGELSDDLYFFLHHEALRQHSIHNLKNAWLIRSYLREMRPNDINNILYLIYLEVNLNIFVVGHLTDWNLLEIFESSAKGDIYTSLVLETFHELKKLNIPEVTNYLSRCELKFPSLEIQTSESLVIKKRESPKGDGWR